MHKVFPALSLLFAISLTCCYYNSVESLFPETGNGCDTIGVTFSSSVQPILEQYCYSCHDNSNASSRGRNIRLEDVSDVVVYAADGSLYGSVAHESGYSPMPRGRVKLDECNISIIRIWIESGTPDN